MDGRGLTLRSKGSRRPQISAPQPISDPRSTASSSNRPPPAAIAAVSIPSTASGKSGVADSSPPRKTQPSGATSDLVKRRYSSRYNQQLNFDIPNVPSLPSGVDAFRSQKASAAGIGPEASGQPLRVELSALKNPSLPVEKYVTTLLANASEEDIRAYQAQLRKLKNRTSTDLQQNVYRNRTQFIKISKEAEKLKAEMITLRGLMSELTTALGQASATNGSSAMATGFDEPSTVKRHPNRSSVANLESMWNVQLQTLWKTVERSQKFLPAIPGRHIVLESGQWVELDSATWKPKRPVHIFLLNDHLLVAAKKRKRVDPNSQNMKGPAPTKLVAEECWPLQDIDMIDLATNLDANGMNQHVEERGVPNAINIRYSQKSFTYRSDKREGNAKVDLLMTFRKTLEDLRKLMRTETESSSKTPDPSTNRLSLSRGSQIFDSRTASRDKLDVLIDVDGKQQNMRWVEGQLDELDIDAALQRFDNAVSRVEQLRKLAKSIKGNVTAQDIILSKIDERATKLAETILRTLVDTHSFLAATKTNISWLSRLGFDDRAREAFLHTRTEVITKRARQCVFEGDLRLYIFQVSYVYFTLIKNTIAIYQQCFPAPMTSACIKWAKEHLDGFNAILVRQLSSVEPENSVWQGCMETVHEHAALLLEVGVDFKDLVGKGLPTSTAVNTAPSTVGERPSTP
ncbi:exocyst complex component exo84 [Blastomyces dermatitidis]|uniref:Exocyst complex component EXO84 n=1 Tax=Blastomyces gilchristii (strain SLH14081) TaxID=559298 RepID=A0A179UB01_BLAGS|nr:exocyst complex component exo84 [Blastomyces gilchristii SLH14081]EQL31637.1 exocyst complex component exo84 [Blastomyces dermatitidis ATCC 26199]OAT05196.1 exocyst complex component exo84 [Blastomyces gilchristii SLH14081]